MVVNISFKLPPGHNCHNIIDHYDKNKKKMQEDLKRRFFARTI